MKQRVISYKQLPARLPINHTLVWYVFLDHIGIPGWLWGVWGTVFGFFWIASCVELWRQETVELTELKDRRQHA